MKRLHARKTRCRCQIESVESRRLLAYLATLVGGLSTFQGSGLSPLVITRDANGSLRHNRFAEGDGGFSSSYDFNSILTGVQTLNAGPTTKIYISNASGDTALEINDSARTSAGTYWVYDNAIDLPDGTHVQYDDALARVSLMGGTKNDTLNLISTRGNLPYLIDAGSGDDSIDVGAFGSMANIRNGVTLDGGAGSDRLTFDDSVNGATGMTYYYAPGFLQRPNTLLTHYDHFEKRELFTTEQADTVSMRIDNFATELLLKTLGGIDDIKIESNPLPIYNSFLIDAGAGNDKINIAGTGPDHTVKLTAGSGNEELLVHGNNDSASNVQLTGPDTIQTLDVGYNARLILPTGGANTLVVNSTYKAAGFIDLNDQTMILKSPPVLSTIRGHLQIGYANGAWNGGGTGAMLSTYARLSGNNDGIGYATAGDIGVNTYVGVSVASSALIVTHTLMGDSNLDGTVDFTDLLRLAQNYGTNQKHWSTGNFNYDSNGFVDFSDLLILAQTYGSSQVKSNRARSRAADLVIA